MPSLHFRIKQSHLKFAADHDGDEWLCHVSGTCVRTSDDRSFTIKQGTKDHDGFGAETLVALRKREPRVEGTTIEIDDRDHIRILLLDSTDEEKPQFELSISLPPDAYDRVTETNWSKENLVLTVRTSPFGQPLAYGHDPDGREIEWKTEEGNSVEVEEVLIEFCSAGDSYGYEEEGKETPEVDFPLDQVIASVERATKAIAELRTSVIRAAWLLAAVVVVAALLR